MRVERDFLDNLLSNFHTAFTQEQNWCEISGTTPQIDMYKMPKYQKLYALKYLPAYYFEYCILANKLHQRLCTNNQEHIQIASLGCGLAPDYFALKHNFTHKHFSYHGYDACEWSTKRFMPDFESNFNFHMKSLARISQDELCKYDAFIFPKSIGDIYDSAKNYETQANVIENLAERISNTPKNKVYFLNSYVSREKQNKSHLDIFLIIHNKLIASGFSTSDNPKDTFTMGDFKGQGLKGVDYNFHYDDKYRIVCQDQVEECGSCNVVKSPIFTNTFMDYQILEYSR